jgi:hypothetical protein
MALGRICPGCGDLVEPAVGCAKCEPDRLARERERTQQRSHGQPWRRLYSTSAWKKARVARRRRDGGRCVVVEHDARCPVRTRLQAHHRPRSLEELWHLARGEWDEFVRLATDLEQLVTTCPRHNAMLDARRRAPGGPAVF